MIQFFSFAISVLVLMAGHGLFGFIIIRLFEIESLSLKITVMLISAFLFLSTVAASYLIHKWDNILTRWYYILAGFWVGMLANSGLMALVVLILKMAENALGFSLPLLAIKALFIGGTVVISLVGLHKAWVQKITEYEVDIKDLPESWDGKTIVQISDVHLGPVYRERSLKRLLAKVQGLEPEAIFITGDLFDGMESDFDWVNHPFSKMRVPRGIYYSFGNHDLYLGFNRVIGLLKENPVIILDNKMKVVDGLQVIGINYSFNKDFDLEAAILEQVGYRKDRPSILLFHEPKNTKLAKQAEIDLQLSGHTHNGQLFPFNYLVKWNYQGYNCGLFKDGDFSLVVNRGAGTWGPPLRTSGQSEIVKIILRKK